MDLFYTDRYEWQTDLLAYPIHEINSWTQVTCTYRSTVVFDRSRKAFFHSEDFFHWGHRPDQILFATFMLALEIKFKWAQYLHDGNYETGDDYDLPQPFNKSTHIYSVSSGAKASFSPADYQKPMIPTFLSTPNEEQLSPLYIKQSKMTMAHASK